LPSWPSSLTVLSRSDGIDVSIEDRDVWEGIRGCEGIGVDLELLAEESSRVGSELLADVGSEARDEDVEELVSREVDVRVVELICESCSTEGESLLGTELLGSVLLKEERERESAFRSSSAKLERTEKRERT